MMAHHDKMKLDKFDNGLTAECRVESCNGLIVIDREPVRYHLNPDCIWCVGCGQRYEIDTHGLFGLELEKMLRAASRGVEPMTVRRQDEADAGP